MTQSFGTREENNIPEVIRRYAERDMDERSKAWMAWKKKYAYIPMKVDKKIVWRKHYWIRQSMKRYNHKVIALEKPKLAGHYYGLMEIVSENLSTELSKTDTKEDVRQKLRELNNQNAVAQGVNRGVGIRRVK